MASLFQTMNGIFSSATKNKRRFWNVLLVVSKIHSEITNMALTEGERERLNSLARGNVTILDAEAREVFDELVDDAILGLAFEVHR